MIATKDVKYYLSEYTKKYNYYILKKNTCDDTKQQLKCKASQHEIAKILCYLDKVLSSQGNIALGDFKTTCNYKKFLENF